MGRTPSEARAALQALRWGAQHRSCPRTPARPRPVRPGVWARRPVSQRDEAGPSRTPGNAHLLLTYSSELFPWAGVRGRGVATDPQPSHKPCACRCPCHWLSPQMQGMLTATQHTLPELPARSGYPTKPQDQEWLERKQVAIAL